jgi:hypothetical protein
MPALPRPLGASSPCPFPRFVNTSNALLSSNHKAHSLTFNERQNRTSACAASKAQNQKRVSCYFWSESSPGDPRARLPTVTPQVSTKHRLDVLVGVKHTKALLGVSFGAGVRAPGRARETTSHFWAAEASPDLCIIISRPPPNR